MPMAQNAPAMMRTQMTDNEQKLKAVRHFALACHYEQTHSEQVTHLAKMLFDALYSLHKLDSTARFWLSCAGILHDIGWANGQKGHHKASMDMILEDRTLPLTQDERKIVALTARYHRKSLPSPSHPVYPDLTDTQRKIVNTLAAILRVADGLDRSHTAAILSLRVTQDEKQIRIYCRSRGLAADEMHYAKAKADLLEQVFKRTTVFTQELL